MLTLEHLASLVDQHREALQARVEEFHLGPRHLAFNARPYVMGVINLSADSWYRESVTLNAEAAIRRGNVLLAQGADILDIGAESTLLQARQIDPQTQSAQLLPVIEPLHARGALISVETYHAAVATACLDAGACVVNLTGTDPDEAILRCVAERDGAVILCYVQGVNVRAVTDFDLLHDPIAVMYEFFARQTERATRCGIRRILLDPGLGFYYRNLKDGLVRVRHQMKVFLNSFRLRRLGWPVCHALPHAFEFFGEEVRSAEGFFAVLAALGRTDLFRTHEVPRVRAVLDTLCAF